MSSARSGKVKFDCGFDHSQTESCHGHTLEIVHHNTSDTVSIEKDGETAYVMSYGEYGALAKLVRQEETMAENPRSLQPPPIGFKNPWQHCLRSFEDAIECSHLGTDAPVQIIPMAGGGQDHRIVGQPVHVAINALRWVCKNPKVFRVVLQGVPQDKREQIMAQLPFIEVGTEHCRSCSLWEAEKPKALDVQ